jgi:Xaa-Pro dipeptidase
VTVGGASVPPAPDLARMHRDRHAKLQRQLEAQGLDGLVLLGGSAGAYATGANVPGVDGGRAALLRPVAIVVKGETAPHLYTPYPEGAPIELAADHVHGPLYPDLDDGMPSMASALADLLRPGCRVGVDEQTHAMLRRLDGFEWVGAAGVLGAAKVAKSADELACIRAAQRINERAMRDVYASLSPGDRQIDLTARLLRRIFELGATSNAIDPIWQVMPPTRADGAWTTHGDIAFPTVTTDRFLRESDVIWVDAGIVYEGYASDFGRTWIVGSDVCPTRRQQVQFERWQAVVDSVLEICKPGVSALELTRAAVAANDGVKPWLEHFYLAHGVGTDSAEMPLVGTDLGDAFDERLVLTPGMVLVLEPAIWDDGAAGYRAEDVIAVSDEGWMQLGSLRAIPGLASATTIGTDALTPGFAELLAVAAKSAAIVDAGRVVSEARRAKTADEIGCIATATALAEAGLAAMIGALEPGVTECELLAVIAERLAGLGAQTPATEGVVCGTSRDGRPRLRQLATGRPVGPAELVVLNPGALFRRLRGRRRAHVGGPDDVAGSGTAPAGRPLPGRSRRADLRLPPGTAGRRPATGMGADRRGISPRPPGLRPRSRRRVSAHRGRCRRRWGAPSRRRPRRAGVGRRGRDRWVPRAGGHRRGRRGRRRTQPLRSRPARRVSGRVYQENRGPLSMTTHTTHNRKAGHEPPRLVRHRDR